MQRFKQLFYPSAVSAVVMILLPLVMMAGQYFMSTDRFTLLSYLFGANTSGDLIQTADTSFAAFSDTVFGNPVLNRILFFCFWMLIGLVIYLILSLLIKSYHEIDDVVHEWRYVHVVRESLAESLLTRSALRLALIITAVLYGIILVRFVLPLTKLFTIIGGNSLPTASAFAYIVMSFLILVLSTHVVIVLVRAIALRVRLLGTAEPEGSGWHS